MTAPEQLSIDTPEQIAIEFALASIGSRFLAVALDSLIQAALLFALALVALAFVAALGAGSATTWVLAVLLLAAFVVYAGYFAAFEIVWQGQTPGKRVVGLRVMAASGHPITVYQAILRNVLRIVDQIPGLYGVGIISVFVTANNQRLGDIAAGTVVVHERPAEGQLGLAAKPSAFAEVSARTLTAPEIAAVERFLERRHDLDWPVRDRTSLELANRVRRRLGLPAGGSDEELLERVAHDYRVGAGYR